MQTLLVGNTAYVTEAFLEEAFPDDQVYICGPTDLKTARKKNRTVFSSYILDQDFDAIFSSYEFEQIVYLSDSLGYAAKSKGEMEALERVLSLSDSYKNLHFLYLMGPKRQDGQAVLEALSEELCLNWPFQQGTTVKVMHCPYLYSGTNEADFFYRLFNRLEKGEEVLLLEHPDSRLPFMSLSDLASLLSKLLPNWLETNEVIHLADPFQLEFSSLIERISQLNSSYQLRFSDSSQDLLLIQKGDSSALRERYGWFMRYSLVEDLEDLYRDFKASQKKKANKERLHRGIQVLDQQAEWAKILEILLIFLIFEGVKALTNSQVQFQMLDIRLLFVVLISTVFGTFYGLFAAFLAILALTLNQLGEGTSWQLLFYNTDRWLGFVAYIFIAVVCGFVQMKNQDDKQLLQKENTSLLEETDFLRQAYQTVVKDKQEFKREVLGSRNGFARWYQIFQQLDQGSVGEILEATLRVTKDLVGGRILLYMGGPSTFTLIGRKSKSLAQNLYLDDFPEIQQQVLEDQVWVNQDGASQEPDYVFAFKKQGRLRYIVWVEGVDYARMNAHQHHQLEVLAGMSRSFINKAQVMEMQAMKEEEE